MHYSAYFLVTYSCNQGPILDNLITKPISDIYIYYYYGSFLCKLLKDYDSCLSFIK